MKVLITGGAGYIGSHLVQTLLDAGHKPVVLDEVPKPAWWPWTPEEVGYVECDIVAADWDYEFGYREALAKVDACVHLAAVSDVEAAGNDSARCFRVNTVATLALANEWARLFPGKPFVFASTAAVYGQKPPDFRGGSYIRKYGWVETDPCNAEHPYGQSKLYAELGLKRIRDLNWAALRLFNVAGAWPEKDLGERHEPETHLIPRIIRAITKGEEVFIYGNQWPTDDGTCMRDYVHVRDVANAFVKALDYLYTRSVDSTEPRVFNIGHVTMSVREVADTISNQLGGHWRPEVMPAREGDVPILRANTDSAQKVLGWKPARGFGNIVGSAIEFEQMTSTSLANAQAPSVSNKTADELASELKGARLASGAKDGERLSTAIVSFGERVRAQAFKEASEKPVPMLLWCPQCSARHYDEGEFETKVHHTHACQTCGHVWRPALVATVGVRFLPGFRNKTTATTFDTETREQSASPTPLKAEPIRVSWCRRVISAKRIDGAELTELTVDGSRRSIPFDLFDGQVVSHSEGLQLGFA